MSMKGPPARWGGLEGPKWAWGHEDSATCRVDVWFVEVYMGIHALALL